MKLYYSPTSPYARKTRLVVLEKGLEEAVTLIPCDPFGDPPELIAANVLGKVPTLVLDDGEIVFDSPVICACLDQLGPGPRLIPTSGPARWRVLRGEALADGIVDAAYNIVMERRRPESQRSPEWIERWEREIGRALNEVERTIGHLGEAPDLADLALGAALGYLDLRLAALDWRKGRPQTTEWFARLAERPSMRATKPESP